MSCPPIPPNCDCFKIVSGVTQFVWPNGSTSRLDADYERERPIIAAMARAAWNDEVARFDAENKPMPWQERRIVMLEAERKAEEWRLWGLAK